MRVLARVIDAVLLSFLIGLPIALVKFLLLGFLTHNSAANSAEVATVLLNDKIVSTVSYVMFYIAVFLNDVVFVAFKGANIGKLLIGLRVINAETGDKPTFGQAAVRTLVYFSVPMVFSFISIWVSTAIFQSLAILSYIWAPILLITIAISPPTFQGWHDKAARTTVIKKL
ncbi:RDD family protein [Stomatohabitans albus]|uniref:RDD family protein n=1 Tax=Stomatohabitans albus TaxID=3110766 RepID=UPI00300D638F